MNIQTSSFLLLVYNQKILKDEKKHFSCYSNANDRSNS